MSLLAFLLPPWLRVQWRFRLPAPVLRTVFAFGLVILLVGCGSNSVSADDDTGGNGLRVLFIGNSLTYANDLPAMVAALAEADGQPITYKVVALPDVSLEDHWLEGTARAALEDENWDVVVMQQGPSSLPESQVHLRTWAHAWADVARERGAVPALYMVWPSDARQGAFPDVILSYTNAAAAADARLYPAGSAWLLAWERTPEMLLYEPDGFHPSEAGSYLAALVIYGGLTGAALTGLPAQLDLPGGTLVIPEAQAQTLQEVAAAALAKVE